MLITTPSGIYARDHRGLHRLFSSSKKGILAATEAKDGSQLLAVADRHTVVLHDCERNREQSWGLEGDESRTRLLEYAPDTRNLFLSTSLTGAVQYYSVVNEEIEDVGKEHPMPPTVLAVSPDGDLLISASEKPTVVLLQNLRSRRLARQLHPKASDKSVVVAAFHPERSMIFLLAFKDGSLAAYELQNRGGGHKKGGIDVINASQDLNGTTKEIGRFNRLHRMTNCGGTDPTGILDSAALGGWDEGTNTTSIGSKSVAISGAAFLPGYKSRAVSVGGDGRCRLVDFEHGGTILNTWDAGPNSTGAPIPAAITSVSVLGIKGRDTEESSNEETEAGQNTTKQKIKRDRGGIKESMGHIIAIGRIDGMVLLFDCSGIELETILAEEGYDRIVSVEWVKGLSPRNMSSKFVSPHSHERHKIKEKTRAVRKAKQGHHPPPSGMNESGLGLPSVLKKPGLHLERILNQNTAQESSTNLPSALKKPNRQIGDAFISPTVETNMSGALPVEDLNTVRRSPVSVKSSPHVRFAHDNVNQIDLFSPDFKAGPIPMLSSKSPAQPGDAPPKILTRPRLSSKTFIRVQDGVQVRSNRSKYLDSHPENGLSTSEQGSVMNTDQHSQFLDIPRPPPFQRRRRYPKMSNHDTSSTENHLRAPVLGHDQVDPLIQIKVGPWTDSNSGKRRTSNPALFAPYMNRTGTSGMPRTGYATVQEQTAKSDYPNTPNAQSKIRYPLDSRVSGPVAMTISGDGVESVPMSPKLDQSGATGLQSADIAEAHRSSDRDAWFTATASDSEGLSPRERRSKVRERLRASVHRPLAGMEIWATYDTVSFPDIMSEAKTRKETDDIVTVKPPYTGLHVPLSQGHILRPILSEQLPRNEKAENVSGPLSTSDEPMYTATSYISIDGTFFPASDNIRSIYPRNSSLSHNRPSRRKRKERKAIDRASPYSQPKYGVSKRSLTGRPKDRVLPPQSHSDSPPPLPPKNELRSMSTKPMNSAGGRHSVDPGFRKELIAANRTHISAIDSFPLQSTRISRPRVDAMKAERRHRVATKAAWALLGGAPPPPLPSSRGLHRASRRIPIRGQEEQEGEETGGVRIDDLFDDNGIEEILLVRPGLGSKDRKTVEKLTYPTTTERHQARLVDIEAETVEGKHGEAKMRDEAVLKSGKRERCKNCRVLLKTKRELQDEVSALRAEMVKRERISRQLEAMQNYRIQ